MSYTFTPTGWYATFDRKRSPGGIVQRDIEGWSPEGDALAVDERAGKLMPVRSMTGFQGLLRCSTVAAVIPAEPGWRVHYAAEKTDPSFEAPVGWAIGDNGYGLPLIGGGDGVSATDELDSPSDHRVTLLEPGQLKHSPLAQDVDTDR
jgi:hypothetical protein